MSRLLARLRPLSVYRTLSSALPWMMNDNKNGGVDLVRLLDGDRLGQVTGEVDINTSQASQVVRQELERDDGQETLETVNGLGNTDGLGLGVDGIITLVADDDGLTLAGSDLLQSRADLGVQRVAGHNQNDGHVLIN